jgi:UDP-N-acetylmuramate--alanine ligase
MHVFFSGIGGAGIGPLAQIARQAGYEVSGSDKQSSSYIDYLRKHGITDINIGQDESFISKVHDNNPIDWFVYTSALPLENPNSPELIFCKSQGIKTSKRDELLNLILEEKHLNLIAVAGTHGKTTTTAMTTWLLKKLNESISYLLPAKTSFAEMGAFDEKSQYFIYEADEFDRNFLAYEPHLSLITGVSWDHHEVFVSREDYQDAFKEFIDQSGHTLIWEEDADYLSLGDEPEVTKLNSTNPALNEIKLLGKYNRLDAWLAIQAVHHLTNAAVNELIRLANEFPGLSRRMEQILPNLYSDYAHTPEKIRGAMSVALETASEKGQRVIVVYEPLTNRRQHYIMDEYKDSFAGAAKLYWVPSYLAREDPKQSIIPPEELITHLDNSEVASPMELDNKLKQAILKHLEEGDMVVGMSGGGGNSLDDWLRQEFN